MADFLFAPKYSDYSSRFKGYSSNVNGNRYCYSDCPNNRMVNSELYFDPDRYDPIIRCTDQSCDGYNKFTGNDVDNHGTHQWSLAHIIRSVLIGHYREPPALGSGGLTSDHTILTHCVANTGFGQDMDSHLASLAKALSDRFDFIQVAREGMIGFCQSGIDSSLSVQSPIGCCPMLPVPDNGCPDWDIWAPITDMLVRYDRSSEHHWVRIVFLWRLLACLSAFTFGLSFFSRLNARAETLKDTFVSWHCQNVVLRGNRLPFCDLPLSVNCNLQMLKDQDALMLMEFEIPKLRQL